MPIDEYNPHRVYRSGYGIAFYRDNSASCEAEANRAVVFTGFAGMAYPEFKFDLPAERMQMENLEDALTKAHSAGYLAAKEEIRRVLGVAGVAERR